MQQEVVLALLAKEPSHGYELRAQIERALGPLGAGFNAGQMYVTLGRLEQAGLVSSTREAVASDRPERRTYELTAAGRERVDQWLSDVTWPRPDLTNFHLKLMVAAAQRLAEPLDIVAAQRRELVRRLRDAQRAAMAEPDGSDAALLLEGVVLRIEADLTWLDACERTWSDGR
ncbi:MAG: PadR family transcriptional regulator [Nocardioides sp.]|nr:PadR family transcriptional regulator [Nocardioides sp.]